MRTANRFGGMLSSCSGTRHSTFDELQETAKKQHRSRSELFTIAVKEYLERIKSQNLLSSLNEVYSEPEEAQDTTLRQTSKKYYSRELLKEPY
ncbi:MAG: ribbon-helix-helix protein, CopG family [Nitrospirae bacterium]|nr:ribbon-helix-helix protein, CopG family [Nitrospirota bacterium]